MLWGTVLTGAFLVLVGWMYLSVHTAGHDQELVRTAELRRAGAMRLQLDEETGVRGFIASRDRVFLEPYTAAAPRIEGVIGRERSALQDLLEVHSVTAERLADDELQAHRAWESTFARPAIADPARATLQLQLRGKALIDRYRADNEAISHVLVTASADSEERSQQALARILLFGAVGG
ncbi:MAG TPA: CHASE3 domain-containing protein, partial [Candidatus Baltobacteraceae bacterium]